MGEEHVAEEVEHVAEEEEHGAVEQTRIAAELADDGAVADVVEVVAGIGWGVEEWVAVDNIAVESGRIVGPVGDAAAAG